VAASVNPPIGHWIGHVSWPWLIDWGVRQYPVNTRRSVGVGRSCRQQRAAGKPAWPGSAPRQLRAAVAESGRRGVGRQERP
jgi:hypothetical protein